jgi:hypothetical protein
VQLIGHAPWQGLVDTIDFVIGDMGRGIVQLSTWVDVVQRAGADQRLHRGCPFAAAVGTSKQEILPTRTHATQRVLRNVVVDIERTVFAVQR